ncbi:MAG: extracellular solute-binding protein [Clostridiales bacterium]
MKMLKLIIAIMILISSTACNKDNNNETVKKSSGNQLEMFSWWTGGGEANGLSKMFEMYSSENKNIEIINSAVSGGAGSNAKTVLKTRIMGGDPPDSFQIHAGMEIYSWVEADKLENIDNLFEDEGWEDNFPKDLLDILKIDGHYYSVPVNIHRSNVLWYNKKIFEENNIEVPKNMDEFFSISKQLKSKDIIPIALGDNGHWVDVHTFESLLLSELGYEGYNGLWDGKTKWDDKKVTKSLENFSKLTDYINEDHSSLSWDQAAQMIIDGKAAMTIMGDWADGFFKSKDFTDFGWAPTPGTDGVFLMLSDSFAIPKDCKNKDNALKWLKLCGSTEGQDAFNPLKGSIPARIDAGNGDYDEYLKSTMNDWSSDKISPSMAHGAAALEGWVTEFTDIVGGFVTTKKVDDTQKQLIKLSEKYIK